MTLRKLLVLPMFISLLMLVFLSPDIYSSYKVLLASAISNVDLFIVLTVAVILQIGGHIIRAYKMHYLLNPVKKSTVRFQFRALSIGYLCNVILPFRLGELVRAKVMASGDHLSFGLTLFLIVIERVFDALVLLAILVVFMAMNAVGYSAAGYAAVLAIVAGLAATGLILAARQNQRVLSMWYHFTKLFNSEVKDGLRFKAWSVIYGLQRVVTKRRTGMYVVLTLSSWTCYVMSTFIVVKYVVPSLHFIHSFVAAVSPYYGMSAPAGPASLGAFSKIANDISFRLLLSGDERIVIDMVLWVLLALPISFIGLVLLAWKTREPVRRRLPRSASNSSLIEKLSREENISTEMGNFLDNYFSGNSLSRIVHRLELHNNFRLLKYFKGGSDAITVLAQQHGETVVKKIIPKDVAPRLKAQYDWLKRHGGKHGMVSAIREQHGPDFYAIDLVYDEKDEMYFEYIHHSTLEESKTVLDSVWKQLYNSLYHDSKKITDHKALQCYIDTHIFGCMTKACTVNNELLEASRPRYIRINGKQYLNLDGVMRKITASKEAMNDLATFSRSSEVHGDVAIDNILVSRSTKKPLIIDPAPDGNLIVGPVFDFGKNLQSLYCGYEFIIHSDDVVILQSDGSIEYHNRRSQRFKELCDYVIDDLSKKYLSDGERRAMIFHAGALHIRRLKHQVYQAPGLTLAIYAAGVQALNDFLELYDSQRLRQ